MELYTCPICLELIEENDQCIINCNHIFCKACIDNCIERKNFICSLCRGQIKNYTYQDNIHNFIYTTVELIRENTADEVIININHKLRRFLGISHMSILFMILLLNYRSNQLYTIINEYNECIQNQTYNQDYINSLEEQNHLLLHSINY